MARRGGEEEALIAKTAAMIIGRLDDERAEITRSLQELLVSELSEIDGDGELLEANPSLLQMLGHDADTMRVSAWPDMMRAYDQAAFAAGQRRSV